jgi:hypothetical protein
VHYYQTFSRYILSLNYFLIVFKLERIITRMYVHSSVFFYYLTFYLSVHISSYAKLNSNMEFCYNKSFVVTKYCVLYKLNQFFKFILELAILSHSSTDYAVHHMFINRVLNNKCFITLSLKSIKQH